MTDAYVQVPADSTGKKLRMISNTVGADTVLSEAVFQVDSTGNPVISTNPAFIQDFTTNCITETEYADATTIYQGEAVPGSATASAVWRIRKITLDAMGRPIRTRFAASLTTFSQVWDNRAGLTYG